MFPPSTASTSLQACATSIDVHATIMRLLVGIMTKPSRISLFMSKIYYKCQIRTGKSAFPRFAWLDSDSAVLCNGPLKQVTNCWMVVGLGKLCCKRKCQSGILTSYTHHVSGIGSRYHAS